MAHTILTAEFSDNRNYFLPSITDSKINDYNENNISISRP